MRKLPETRWRERWKERQVDVLVRRRHHQGWLDRSYGQRKRGRTHRLGVREDQTQEPRCLWSLWTRNGPMAALISGRTVRLWRAGELRHFRQAGPWVRWPSKGCLHSLKHSAQVSHLRDLTPRSSWGMSRKCQFLCSVALQEGRDAGTGKSLVPN